MSWLTRLYVRGVQDAKEATEDSHCAEAWLRQPKLQWEGWGCSLAWFGKVLGATPSAQAWADLFFGIGELPAHRVWSDQDGGLVIPCLGLNIVRYNIGGVGHAEKEKRSRKSRGWHAEIEGFQPHVGEEFNWDRDAEQRLFLKLAVERGADTVELFANAPMWWMTDSNSSFGGRLAKPDDFIAYLVEVTSHMRSHWQVPVASLSPFNEPSAGWWKFPHDQEGCNIPASEQESFIVKLRGELDRHGLVDVIIAASDENTPCAALETCRQLDTGVALSCLGRVNVHGYDGLRPWRETKHPGVRRKLCSIAGEKKLPIWISEFGGGETSGMELAQSILEDVHFLRPQAWCYWQLVENKCSWGFIEAEFSTTGANKVKLPHPKYYVFAHFTRYIRPGVEILYCTKPWAMVAYSSAERTLTCVLLNSENEPKDAKVGVRDFCLVEANTKAYITQPVKKEFFAEHNAEINEFDKGGFVVSVLMPPQAICSVIVTGATLCSSPTGLSATQAIDMARCAAQAAVMERRNGQFNLEAQKAWAHFEHMCDGFVARLRAGSHNCPDKHMSDFDQLKHLIVSSAWGVANERALGSSHRDAIENWEQFHAIRGRRLFSNNLVWAVFNTVWSVANAAWFGKKHQDYISAAQRASDHLQKLGIERLILPRKAFSLPEDVPSSPRWLAFVRHAEAGHNADPTLNNSPDNGLTSRGISQAEAARKSAAGSAVRSADLVITTPLLRALQTTSLLTKGEYTGRTMVEALATEAYKHPCDDGRPKTELLELLPSEVQSWEGWDALPEIWWPGLEDNVASRLDQFRRMLHDRPEDRIVFIGHGGFWEELLGYYLDNCEAVFCDRLLA